MMLKKLLEALDEIEEKDEWRFIDVPFKRVLTTTDKAVLIEFDRYAFYTPTKLETCELWFPLSMMRKDSADNVFFDKKIATEKGLNI